MPHVRRTGGKNPDGTMSLMEHLYELRRRLFFAVLALFVGAVIGFIWYTVAIPGIGLRSLGDILIEPYCTVPASHRVDFGLGSGDCSLLATTPFSILQIRLKAAIMAGAVLSCPFWFYQLWRFVTPALYSKERRFAVTFVSLAALLFACGAVMAYLVLPHALAVLLGFGGNTAITALSPDSYFSFLSGMLLVFGLSFELPLLLIMLNFVGVVSGIKLAKARRYAIFGLVVFAGLVVPGNDPISMGVLAVILAILYEVAVQVSKLHDKRKSARRVEEGFAGLDDDVASPMPAAAAGHATDPLDAAGPVDSPMAVSVPAPVPVPVASDAPVDGPYDAGPYQGSAEQSRPAGRDLGDAT